MHLKWKLVVFRFRFVQNAFCRKPCAMGWLSTKNCSLCATPDDSLGANGSNTGKKFWVGSLVEHDKAGKRSRTSIRYDRWSDFSCGKEYGLLRRTRLVAVHLSIFMTQWSRIRGFCLLSIKLISTTTHTGMDHCRFHRLSRSSPWSTSHRRRSDSFRAPWDAFNLK